MFAALLGLGMIIVLVGPAISLIPMNALRIFVGTLSLWFGISWLRKAVLRQVEEKLCMMRLRFIRESWKRPRAPKAGRRFAIHDWYAFTVSFKGTFLEGIEIAFQ
jgi:uncharacterized membrane protein